MLVNETLKHVRYFVSIHWTWHYLSSWG